MRAINHVRARSLAYKARAVLAVFILSLIPAFLFNIDRARSEATVGVPASCGSSSMSSVVERTGSAGSFNNTANNSSQSVTVPADTEIMILGVAGYDAGNDDYYSNSTVTIGGDPMAQGAVTTTDDAAMGGLWYRVNPSTGSQTLAWNWDGSGSPDNGTVFTYSFYKGINTADPIGDTDVDDPVDAATATTTSLTIVEGDAIVAVGGASGTESTWTNATETVQQVINNGGQNTVSSQAEAFPSSNTSVSHTTNGDGGFNFSMVAAMVLNQASAVVSNESCLTMDGYTFENDDGQPSSGASTPTIDILDFDSGSGPSITTASVEPTSGTKVYIAIRAISDNHTNAFNWSISTSGVTWTLEHESAEEDSDPGFRSKVRVYSADAWAGAETTTFSAFASGNEVDGWSLFEIADADPGNELAQAIVTSISASTPTTETATYGSALTAGTLRVGFWAAEIDDNGGSALIWDTPPTDWTETTGGTLTGQPVPMEQIESTTGTTTSITHGGTLSGDTAFTMSGTVFEFAGASSASIPSTTMAGSEFSSGQTLDNVRKGQRITLRTQISNVGAGAVDSADELGLFYDRGDGYWSQVGYANPPVTGSGSGCDSNLWTCEDIASTDDLRYSSMAIDPEGRPWIAYYNFTNGDLELAKYVGRGGSGCVSAEWTCTTLDSTGDVGRFTSIAIDENGKAWIAYADTTGSRLKVAQYVGSGGSCDDTAWDCETVDFTGQYTAIALDSAGNPWVSYRWAANSDLKVARYVGGATGSGCSDSSDWDCTSVDSTVNGGEYTSIAIGSGGVPWVSYYDIGNTALKVAQYVGAGGNCDDTAWDCSTVDANDTVGQFTSIAVSPANIPWVSYYDATSGDLKVAANTGVGGNCDDTGGSDDWACTSVVTATDAGGFHSSIAFAPDGLPWITYYDETGGDLYIARYVDGGGNGCASSAWSCLAIDSTDNMGRFSSLAFSSDGNAWVGYKDATSGGIKVAYVNRGGEIVTSPGQAEVNGSVLTESHADMTSATDTANRDDADCVSSTTWNNGAWFEAPLATGLSIPAGDTTSQCTEVAWMIDTSQAAVGTTYRFIVASKDAFNPHRGIWRGVAGVPSSLPELTIAIEDETTYSYSKGVPGASGSDCSNTDWTCSDVLDTATQSGQGLSMAFRPDGSPVISQYDLSGANALEVIEYVGSSGSGCANAAWDCNTVEATNDTGALPTVAVAADGNPWVAYKDWTADDLAVSRYVGSGGTCDNTAWECETVDDTAGAGFDSEMRVGPDGKQYIAYLNNTAGEVSIAQYVGSGGTGCASTAWTCTVIDSGITAEGSVGMSIDNDGNPWIAYGDGGAADDLMSAQYVGSGGTGCDSEAWECKDIDTGSVNASAGATAMSLDGDGNPWIMYTVGTTELWAAEYVGSGGTGCAVGAGDWNCEQVDNTTSGFPVMATDSEGNPWAAYFDGSNFGVARYVSSGGTGCTSTAWTCENIDSTGDFVQISLAFDATGTPWIAWSDEITASDYDIKIARLKSPPNNLGLDTKVPYNGGISAGSGSLSYLLDLGLAPATGELGECTAIAGFTGYCGLFHPEGYLDSITAQVNERPMYGFSTSFGDNSQLPTAKVYYQSTLAPTSSNVSLQVYRHGTTNAWETIATDSTSVDCSSENCVITGMPSGTASEYFELIDGRHLVNFRAYQQESASVSYTFSIDGFNSSQTTSKLRHGREFRDQATDPLLWQ